MKIRGLWPCTRSALCVLGLELLLGMGACNVPRAASACHAARSEPPALLQASEEPALGGRAGDWEFTIAGEGDRDRKVEQGGVRFAAALGYYVSDVFLVVFRHDLAFEDGVTDTSKAATRIAMDYLPFHARMRPFFGGSFGYVYGESVNETLSAAPETGVKLYLQDRAFLQLMAEYQVFFTKTEDTTEILDRGQFVYSIGLGINF